MADICPECWTATVELVGMTDALTPPAPLKRCMTCGTEVIDCVLAIDEEEANRG